MNRSFSVVIAMLLLAFVAGCGNGDRNVIEASGTIEATEVNIGSEVAGRVMEVLVDEGTRVQSGQTLAVIDSTEYVLQLRQALSNFAALNAQYRLTLEGSRREDIVQAESAFRNARGDFERMKSLLASHTVTQKQYDDAEARYVAAQQTYEKLVKGARREEITAARMRADQAAAQADLLRKRVKDCTVTAPSEGYVTLRGVEPGELVAMGTNLFRITYLARVKLTIYVSEEDLGRVVLGQKADVTIDTFGKSRVFEGTVIYISPSAEFTPKNVQTKEERTRLVYAVKLQIENKEGIFKPGMPADARLKTVRS